MRGAIAIARKELRSYFLAPAAYVIITCFLLLNGFLFAVILRALSTGGGSSASPMVVFFGGTVFFWIFLIAMVPVITMRLGAEEAKSGTLETLLTAPVTDLEVVAGKYLGALALYGAAWLPTVLYAVVLRAYSPVDLGPVASGYLGAALVGMAFLAVGLFTSFASRNQVVAAILAFLILLGFLLVSVLSFLASTPLWKGIFGYLDLYSQMQNYAKGIVDTRSVVFLTSTAAFFLALTYQALQARRLR